MVAITVGKDPCYFPKEFLKIKDLRILIKFKLCAGAVRGCHMFLLNNLTEINEKFVLAWLHTGTGHSHLDSYLNIVRLPSISNRKFKGIERKVGKEIEQVEEDSCKKWKEAKIVINSFYTGLGLFLQISFARWFYLRYFLLSLLPD